MFCNLDELINESLFERSEVTYTELRVLLFNQVSNERII